MKEFFETMFSALEKQEDCVMATIISSKGSVPRGSGARMLMNKNERIDGTIGGGKAEFLTIEQAKNAVLEKKSYTYPFTLRANKVEDIGMICGGDIDIRFSFISSSTHNKDLVSYILSVYEKKQSAWLFVRIDKDDTDNEKCELGVYTVEDGYRGSLDIDIDKKYLVNKPTVIEIQNRKYYVERIINSEIVYIIGGGHVAQALVPVLARLDFRTIVLENREEFCAPHLFEGVEETRLIEYDKMLESIDIHKEDYICIMTRGHSDDTIVEYQAIKSGACYVGVIGSKRKAAAVRARLQKRGISIEELDRVDSPIGIDIDAETPAEIAISIAARLIKERAAKN